MKMLPYDGKEYYIKEMASEKNAQKQILDNQSRRHSLPDTNIDIYNNINDNLYIQFYNIYGYLPPPPNPIDFSFIKEPHEYQGSNISYPSFNGMEYLAFRSVQHIHSLSEEIRELEIEVAELLISHTK